MHNTSPQFGIKRLQRIFKKGDTKTNPSILNLAKLCEKKNTPVKG